MISRLTNLYQSNPRLSSLENARIKAYALYFAISGFLGTLASLSVLGQVDLTNPVNFIIVIVMPLSLVFLAPVVIYYNKTAVCVSLLIYSLFVLCANTHIDAKSGLDSSIFGLILVVVTTLYFSWFGIIAGMAGFAFQKLGMPEFNKWLTPETANLYNDFYYQYAVFDLITALVVALCVLVFRNELLAASNELEKERHRSEMAERAKSNFLANMSHEIRTPMNGVVGMTALLQKTPLNEKQKMFTDIITKSGNSLLTIINDILDFSKLDAGQMELDKAPFNLQEAIEDVAALFSSTISEKDIDIIVRVSPKTPEILIGDVGRIRQVLMNLVGNAVKFTDHGHVYINIECLNDSMDEEGEKLANLSVMVEDTGIGIAQDKIEHIFTKFSQVDESSSRKHEGTGLGLAISSQLIELMDGKIAGESEEGKGSRFSFEISLPVIINENIEPKVPANILGSRLLVVEANPLVSSIRVERFQSWKFDSGSVYSGQECIDCLLQMEAQNLLPDLIVLSCQLEDMDGFEVVAQLRQSASLAQIPIVMLTKVANLEEHTEYSDLKIEANLLKPWHTSVLLQTITTVLTDKLESQKMANEERVTHEYEVGNKEREVS